MSVLPAPVAPAITDAPVTATMQALVVLEPNRFEIQEVPVPTPGPNEVLARVRAVSICGTDAHLIRGDYPGFWPPAFPFIPGHEWAGEIVALGPGAERYGWTVGDRVAGTSHDACGVCQKCVEGRYNLCENYGKPGLHRQYGHNVQGADATYVVHGVKCIFPLPDGLSFGEGAVIDPASIALPRRQPGQHRPGRHRGDHRGRRDRPARRRCGPHPRRRPGHRRRAAAIGSPRPPRSASRPSTRRPATRSPSSAR